MQAAQSEPAVSCRGLRKIYDAPPGGAGRWWRSTGSTSRSSAASASACSARTAPARPPPSRSSRVLAPTAGEVELLGMRGRATSWAARAHRRRAAGDALAGAADGRGGAATSFAASTARPRRSPSCSRGSSSRRSATPGSASCRAASGSGWRSPARWSASRTSSSSTSRRPGSTRSRAASSGIWCCASAAAGGTVAADHALHGRGGAALRPRRDRRPRAHHRGGLARGADPRAWAPQHVIEFALEGGAAGAAAASATCCALPAVTGARLSRRTAVRADRGRAGRALPALVALVAGRGAALRASRPATRRWRTCSSP